MNENVADALVERARARVEAVRDPELGLPLGRLGMVGPLELDGRTLSVVVALTVPGRPMKARIGSDVQAALADLPGIDGVEVTFQAMSDARRTALASELRRPNRFDAGTTAVIAVASGKGGVGKSTIAVNLACAFASAGKRVGLLDADVWGSSVPRMLGVSAAPVGIGGMLVPPEAQGVKVVSAGLFSDERAPIVWRGPMLHKAMEQFVADVYWGELDVLVCDLPPGTGDIAISLAGMLPDATAILVTTPQEAARTVAERAGRMAELAKLRIGGVIENMSSFVCPCCGEESAIFGDGGGQKLADALAVPLLARVPVTAALRESGDRGLPIVLADAGAPASRALREAAARILEAAPVRATGSDPVAVSDGRRFR